MSRALGVRVDIAVAFVAVAIVAAELSVLNVSYPEIIAEFGGSRWTDWVIVSYPLAFGTLLIVAGSLADRLGSRKLLVVGLATTMAATLLSVVAPSAELLVMARVLQGAGSAAIVPSTLRIVTASSAGFGGRTVSIAGWVTAQSTAVVAGGVVGAVAVQWWTWRAGVGALGVLAAVALAAASRHSIEAVRLTDGRIAWRQLSLLSVAVLLGLVAITEANSRSLLFAVAAVTASWVLLVCFLVGERRGSGALFPASVRTDRQFWAASAPLAVFSAAFLANFFVGVLFLRAEWGYSGLAAGLGVAPAGVSFAVTSAPLAKLATRIGHFELAGLGALGFAVSMVYLGTLEGQPADYWVRWFPVSLLVGILLAATMPILNAAALQRVDLAEMAFGGSVVQTGRQLGGAIGVALLTATLQFGTGNRFSLAYILIAGLAACAVVLVVVANRLCVSHPGEEHAPWTS